MPARIELIFTTTPHTEPNTGIARLIAVDTGHPLRVEGFSLVLILELEPGATFARGRVRQSGTGVSYPIQCGAALFEALAEYVARARSDG
jgi:hypothetical protein